MTYDLFWIFIQILALLAVPIAAIQVVRLWLLLRTGRFTYRPLRGEGVPATRAERPVWYSLGVAAQLLSLLASLAVIGFVGFWTWQQWTR